jgi:hypothetical protein
MEFKTRKEMYEHILRTGLECYGNDWGSKVYVRNMWTEENKHILYLKK